MSSIVIHPRIAEAERRVSALRSEIARVLVALDDELEVRAPYLLALYATTIGRWELVALEARWRLLRLRRLVEEAQGALARQTSFDRDEVEEALDREMTAFREEIAWKANEVRRAEWAKRDATPEERARGSLVRAAYRRLVLRLHPDLIGTPTEAQRRFLQRAHEAFAANDLDELTDLEAALGTDEPAAPDESSLEQWEKRERTLRTQLDGHLERLASLATTLPFSLADRLHDEVYLAERMNALTAAAAADDLVSTELTALLDALLLAHHRRHARSDRSG